MNLPIETLLKISYSTHWVFVLSNVQKDVLEQFCLVMASAEDMNLIGNTIEAMFQYIDLYEADTGNDLYDLRHRLFSISGVRGFSI